MKARSDHGFSAFLSGRARAGAQRVPVFRERTADFETPLSIWLKLAGEPYSYLFESVQGSEKWGRYSVIGLASPSVVRARQRHLSLEEDGEVIKEFEVEDPLQWIDEFYRSGCTARIPGLPRFCGGLVGYLGYDAVRYIEPTKLLWGQKPDELGTPDILLWISDEVAIYDNLSGKINLVVHADPNNNKARAEAERRLDEIEARLDAPCTPPTPLALDAPCQSLEFRSRTGRRQHCQSVLRARDLIIAGDCFQVGISQRLSAPFKASPLELYRALRMLNPSPYMFLLNCGDHQIVGSSPEILVRLEGDQVTIRPIAGTRPRGGNDEEDEKLAAELLADEKERAEHLMLVDLARNDLGRIAEIGSVQVDELMAIERYSHVMHISSNVSGRLRSGIDAFDVLRATFPAGTLSGAPKVRAMEIIDDLEPVKRGVYAGAVGYFSWQGNMDTAIAIRTAVLRDGNIHVQAGGGLVYDSVPESEWQETLNKAKALMRAGEIAEATAAADSLLTARTEGPCREV